VSLSQDQITAKLLWLADIEEIKQLKARYAAACDDNYDAGVIADLFTEDAVWDGGMMGFAETRDGIRAFFENASNIVGFAVHGLSNPLIEVDGDRATGRWYLHQPMTLKGSDQCFWFCAQYVDEYVRTADGWKFQNVKIEARAFTPYEQGFGKQLLAELPR
jgi:ketosteroid isomerase-like protein